MIHAREDYNRIQDPAGLIPADEPVFLVRAQDVCAIPTLLAWAHQARAVGASNEIIEKVEDHIRLMSEWKRSNQVKVPDLPSTPHTPTGE